MIEYELRAPSSTRRGRGRARKKVARHGFYIDIDKSLASERECTSIIVRSKQ